MASADHARNHVILWKTKAINSDGSDEGYSCSVHRLAERECKLIEDARRPVQRIGAATVPANDISAVSPSMSNSRSPYNFLSNNIVFGLSWLP